MGGFEARPNCEHGPGRVSMGGVVAMVDAGSPAEAAGIRAGDVIVSAEGHALHDIIDFFWHADGPEVTLGLSTRQGNLKAVRLVREAGTPWGITFEEALFDAVRTCENHCAFCFMSQLPPRMRRSLTVRDDDFRLSFLEGNFITLTNLSDDDVSRIVEQRLSPLHVSLHAVTPSVRDRLICARADRALARFDELVQAGIEVHVQIVLVPGVNDGGELETTLTWLSEREGVQSVGIVPVGYTRHQSRITSSYTDPLAAALVIQQVQSWQFAMRERDSRTWVHLSDEFYLNARAPFPRSEFYDGFPQFENGIGLVRSFVDEAASLRSELASAVDVLPAESECVTVVTGVMAATTLAGAMNACKAAGRVRLLVVPNRFFGGNVSVTGLLTAEDLVSAIRSDRAVAPLPTIYLLPDVVFNRDGVTLDDADAEFITRESGADVRVVSSDVPGLLAGLIAVTKNPPSWMKE